MSRYQEGLKLIEERCGNSKDNTLSLATIDMETGENGRPRPFVRDVDAFYEDGVFYVVTWGKSTKIQQIEQNPEVAFTVSGEWISGNGIGKNLGWVLKPTNAELRTKLRKAFSFWYDDANDESNENCVILAIELTRATVIKDHGAERYLMDFTNQTEGSEGLIK